MEWLPMRDDLGLVLRTGSEQLADTVRVPAAEQVRARGEQRRQRLAMGSAGLAVLAVSGGLAGYLTVAGPHGRGGPVSHGGHGLQLIAPRRLAMGVPNPVSFVVPGSGSVTTVTVRVDLGHPSYVVYRQPVVLRHDSLTGRWIPVRVALAHGHWRGSYSLRVPAWPTRQLLEVVPAAAVQAPPLGAGRLRIQVLAEGKVLGAQAGPPARLAFTDGNWEPLNFTTVPRGQSRQATYRITNHLGFGYGVRFSIYSPFCHSGGSCPPEGDIVQWLDSGTWRSLGPGAYGPGYGQYLRTGWLAAHGSVTIRFRLVAGRHAAPVVGFLYMMVSPARSGYLGGPQWYPDGGSESHTSIITLG